MLPSPHRIRALRWQVRAGSQDEAFALRKWLRDELHSELLPAVAQAFDSAGPVDGVLHIPRLELRLEISSTDRFAERLAELIRRRLRDLLRTATQVQAPPADGAVPLALTREAVEESRLRELMHYLEHGGLSWPLAGSEPATVVSELRLAAAHGLASVLASQSAAPVRDRDPGRRFAFFFRLLQLSSDEDWAAVARAIAAGYPAEPGDALVEAVAALAVDRSGSRYSRLQLAAALLALVGTSLEDRRGAVEPLIALLPDATAEVFRRWLTGGEERTTTLQRPVRAKDRSEGARKTLQSGSEVRAPGVGSSRPSPPTPLPAARPDPRERGDSLRSTLPPSVSVAERKRVDEARKADRAEEADRAVRVEKAERAEKVDRTERAERADKVEKTEIADRAGKKAARRRAPLSRMSGRAAGRGGGGEGQQPETFSQEVFESRFLGAEIDVPRHFIDPATRRGGIGGLGDIGGVGDIGGLRPSPPTPLPAAHPDPRERGDSLRSTLPPSVSSIPIGPAVIRQTPEAGAFPLAVNHAGLILLHPFLPRFFESTGVLEARAVHLPDDMLPRAAALLHRLATGEEEAFELELGFVKILLGLAPGDSLPVASGLLSPNDLDEVDALLQAVIGHWSVLKNTSVAGLRQTFLQRRGLVREREEGIQLQVEPESFDVLLGHLPWSFAVVKLPWMSKAIYTDWPTP